MVVVDGRELFRLVGISSYPAKKRVAKTTARIIRLAKDPSFDPETLTVSEKNGLYTIFGNSFPIVRITAEDVALEGDFSLEGFAKNIIKNASCFVFLLSILNPFTSNIGIPITNVRLTMFDPITVPKTIDEFFAIDDVIPIKSSGKEVAKARIINPLTNSLIFRYDETFVRRLTNQAPDMTKAAHASKNQVRCISII